MTMKNTAGEFFDACESGKGWDVCRAWCHTDASFSGQADALADVTTLEDYCEWMKDLLVPMPDGHYELKAMAADLEQSVVLAFAVFHGTNTVEGPVPATGKTVAADYVYAMEFKDDKISGMTKIWNDGHSLRQLGWA